MVNSTAQAQSSATGIAVVAAALMTIGLVMVASAGASIDRPVIDLRFWETAFGRQLIFSVLGFLAMIGVSHGWHRAFKWRDGTIQPAVVLFLLALGCVGLAMVPGVGIERNGAWRWLPVGPPRFGLVFQPSELAKVALVMLLAAWIASREDGVRTFKRGVLPAAVIIGLCAGLVGVEDFGTAALLGLVGGAVLIVGGARLMHLAILALPGLAAMVGLVVSKPFRVQRLIVFLDIWSDPQGAGYHPIQSLVTIASGGWFGRGLGAGVQKYGYLPEARSDFIFSVICEETGIIGAALVILLFAALLWLGWRVVRNAADPFSRLVAFGMTFLLVAQAAMNIAVVTVCAPTKGISLPFVSAGGSGVVFLGMAVGLLISAAREPELCSLIEPERGGSNTGAELDGAVGAPAQVSI